MPKKDNTLNYALVAGGLASAMFIPVGGLVGLIPASYGAYRAYQNNKSVVRADRLARGLENVNRKTLTKTQKEYKDALNEHIVKNGKYFINKETGERLTRDEAKKLVNQIKKDREIRKSDVVENYPRGEKAQLRYKDKMKREYYKRNMKGNKSAGKLQKEMANTKVRVTGNKKAIEALHRTTPLKKPSKASDIAWEKYQMTLTPEGKKSIFKNAKKTGIKGEPKRVVTVTRREGLRANPKQTVRFEPI